MDIADVQWKIIGLCLSISVVAFGVASFLSHIYAGWTWGTFFHHWYGEVTLGGITSFAVVYIVRFLKIRNLLKQGRLLKEQIKGQEADNRQKERREKINEMKTEMLAGYARVKARDVNSSYMPSPSPGDDVGIFNEALAELKKEHPNKF